MQRLLTDSVQRSPAVQRRPANAKARTKYKPPIASQYLADTFPKVTFTADQTAKLQQVFDGRAAVREIDEDPVWGSILSDDRATKAQLAQERAAWERESQPPQLVVPTEQMLGDDILLKEAGGKTNNERLFREHLYASLLTYPVKIVVAGDVLAPQTTLKWGPAGWVMGSEGGRITWRHLMQVQKFAVAYDAANTKDQIALLTDMLELTRSGVPYAMTGKKVGETYGYLWNSSFTVGPEIGLIGGYVDDARGRAEMERVKGGGGRIVLRNPADGFLHVYSLSLKSTDLRFYDKDVSGDSATGMAFLYARGSQVGPVDEIMTSDGFLLTPGGDSYGQGWGASATLNEYEKFAIGAVLGDGFEDPDAVMTFGQIVMGCVPIVGQVADARDVAVGLHKVWATGAKDGKLQTALAMVGFLPLLGDGIKSAWKAGRKQAGQLTKETAKELRKAAVKQGLEQNAGAATKQFSEHLLRDAQAVAKHFGLDPEDLAHHVRGLEELAAKAAKGDTTAGRKLAGALQENLDAMGGNAGSLVNSMGGDWTKVAAMLKTSPEGAAVGKAMEAWRTAQFAPLDARVAARMGAAAPGQAGGVPRSVRTGTPSFASDVDVSFLGPLSTQHRNTAIALMEEQFGPQWRKLMDADIFADPARLHLFEDPLKKIGGKTARDASKRIVKEAELNTFAKMLKDGVPLEEVKRLAVVAGVDIAEVTARQKEITQLGIDYLANQLRKGTSPEEVKKLADGMHLDFAEVQKHAESGLQLYKQLELRMDALHSQYALAEKAGDVAAQARIAEEMAALQGKLNAAVSGPYMTPGGGMKHVTRREKELRPDGTPVPMSPVFGYTAVIDDLYMLMHALPDKEFTEKSAKGLAKYGDRLLVTAGQFGLEMKGSTRALFDDIAVLLERARLEKDKPALDLVVPKLDAAKAQLTEQLVAIVATVKKTAVEHLKDPTYAGFTEKTLAALGMQLARVGSILLRKEVAAPKP